MTDTRLKIFSGSSNRALAEEICQSIGVPLGDATVTCFPDGESFVKINENIRGADAYFIQSTCPPTNHHLMELLIMIDAAKRASTQRITAVIPFTATPARIARTSPVYLSPPSSWPTSSCRRAPIAS